MDRTITQKNHGAPYNLENTSVECHFCIVGGFRRQAFMFSTSCWYQPASSLCTVPQCCDLGYHASLNRALRTYLSAEYNLETSRHEGLDIIENAVDSLDLRSDRQRFMEMYPTAFCPPAKFEFQAHMGDEVNENEDEEIYGCLHLV